MAEIYDELLAPVAIQPGDQVLDVGGWRGPIWDTVHSFLGPDGRVVLLDLSHVDLSLARAERAADGRLQMVGGNGTDLPLKADAVSVVTTRSVLIYVHDKTRAIQEFHRVLRPAGWVCLCAPIPSQLEETGDFSWGRWRPVRQAIEDLRVAAWHHPLFQAGMECTEELLLRQLHEAGFGAVQRKREMSPKLEHGSPEAVLRMWKPPHLGNEGYVPWEQQLSQRFSPAAVQTFAAFVSAAVQGGGLRVTLLLIFLWARKAEQRGSGIRRQAPPHG